MNMLPLLVTFLASLPFICTAMSSENAPGWPFDLTAITAPDGSITAKFVSCGATLTELWVKDKNGGSRNVVLGYDDNSKLQTDPGHPVFNAVVGRYANRIKNGTFSIPITKDPQPPGPGVYQIPKNDRGDIQTLHGGIIGWDRRNWTVVVKSSTSITYQHVDKADEGFPGDVTALVTHTVNNGGVLETVMQATATEKTPIMLTQHIYWNLDAFQGSDDILDHHLFVDADRVIALDSNGIPTGAFIDVGGTAFDFRESRAFKPRWDETEGITGEGQKGYDNCWVLNPLDNKKVRSQISLWSEQSGIRLDVLTNQPAVQVYTGNWLNTPRKDVHGGPSKTYTRWSAVAIEQQGHVDAINTPEWGVDQIHEPGKDYTWSSTYTFSVLQ